MNIVLCHDQVSHLSQDWLSHGQLVDVELAHHHQDEGDHRPDVGRVIDVHSHEGQEEQHGERQEHDPEDNTVIHKNNNIAKKKKTRIKTTTTTKTKKKQQKKPKNKKQCYIIMIN
jgi:hypothetical protein